MTRLFHMPFFRIYLDLSACSLFRQRGHLDVLYSCPLFVIISMIILNLAEVTRLVGAKLAREIPCNRCGTAEYWCCEMPLSMQALAANASGTLLSPFT